MNRLFRNALFALIFTAPSVAQQAISTGLPPLIDREILFGNAEISGAQLSPDGKYIAFLKPWKDTRNVWVKSVAEPFDKARLLTAETKRPIATFLWTRDSRFLVFAKDNAGDENFNAYAVNPSDKPTSGTDAPVARDLTNLKGVRIIFYDAPRSRPDVIYIGLNDRDKAWHDLYEVNVASGQRKLLRKNTDRATGWLFDPKGELRLARRSAENGDTELLRVDPTGFQKIYACGILETCEPVRVHKDGKRVYIESNAGDTDLSSLQLLDLATGKTELVESDPDKQVDFGSAQFSEMTDELLATSYDGDKLRRYFRDPKWEADYRWLQGKLPNRQISFVSTTADEQRMLVIANGDTEPGQAYLFDRAARTLTPQYRLWEKLDRDSLAETKIVRYKSADGLEIPAYLTLPKGLPAKNLPVVIMPHGGPWSRDTWRYNPYAQFMANRGYALLAPNFRGSTGYGKKFLNAGNLEWGRKMQDDLTWGVKYLIAEGIADPKRVAIMGGSYGGYATLAGVTTTPDLYRAAVDIVGPSNLETLLGSIPPYWEAARKTFSVRMGDLNTPEGKALLKERSPLFAAAKIKTPLLVVQGANDPRVNKREADQIVVALRDRGFEVRYLLADDEGHGFARPVNNQAMLMEVESFLAKHLDGRYQAGGTPEVVARLKEITVDPKTVTVTPLVDASAAGTLKFARQPLAGKRTYQGKLSVGGQELAIKVIAELKQEDGAWIATQTTESPAGSGLDRAVFDKDSLTLTKRNAEQGPAKVELAATGGKVTGKIIINGRETAVNADTGGPVFAETAGAYALIAALPLADNYSAIFRSFDAQKQAVKSMQVKVADTESITTPAGSFDAFRVEIASADGGPDQTSVWVDKKSFQIVKVLLKLPQIPGASMTWELEK